MNEDVADETAPGVACLLPGAATAPSLALKVNMSNDFLA